MNKFEYLSVLVSIVVGLGISHLLSSAARLVQLRHRTRMYGPTLAMMALLFLVNVQIWWAAFDRQGTREWNFFLFLLYLLIPAAAAVLSYLVVPDLEGEETVDLKASYHENHRWFFGILAAIVVVSLAEESLRDGAFPRDVDAGFRVAFLLSALLGARFRGETFHRVHAPLILLAFCAYVFVLFLRLP